MPSISSATRLPSIWRSRFMAASATQTVFGAGLRPRRCMGPKVSRPKPHSNSRFQAHWCSARVSDPAAAWDRRSPAPSRIPILVSRLTGVRRGSPTPPLHETEGRPSQAASQFSFPGSLFFVTSGNTADSFAVFPTDFPELSLLGFTIDPNHRTVKEARR
jgi:hypothetical protein